MDIATVVGFVAGVMLMLIAIVGRGNAGIFFDTSSIIIVFGGMIAATLINFPIGDVLAVFKTVKNAIVHKTQTPEGLIERLVEFATVARREGILALESHAGQAGDAFMKKSVQLAIDGTQPELIKDILTTELAFMEDRHANGQAILVAMGTFAPAFGMIGTLIGLVAMLAEMEDPDKIGEGMAVALLTTFYGALVANLILLPAAGKLRVRTNNEILNKEIIIEGILSIQSGDNPRIVEQKLKSFISPELRDQVVTAGAPRG